MQTVTIRHALFVAAVLAMTTLVGCADVRQNPTSNVVNGQSDTAASQPADAQPASATNIPF